MTLLDPPMVGEDVKSGLPVLLLGVETAGSSCTFWTCDMDGIMKMQDVSEVLADYRYDMKREAWFDASEGLKDD